MFSESCNRGLLPLLQQWREWGGLGPAARCLRAMRSLGFRVLARSPGRGKVGSIALSFKSQYDTWRIFFVF